jgi:hypothetical protein
MPGTLNNVRSRVLDFYKRRKRKALLDPASKLFRTHVFTTADDDIDTEAVFGDDDSRIQAVTFAFMLSRSGTGSGLVYEFGSADRGVAVWIDGGDIGVAAGAGLAASMDDGADFVVEDALPLAGKAVATLTLTANVSDGESVAIAGKVYTFQEELTDVDGNVLIGATASDSLDNLLDAINLGAGAGVAYADLMTENEYVSAQAGSGDTLIAEALNSGASGNLLSVSETLASGYWNHPTLRGALEPIKFVVSIHPGRGLVELYKNGQLIGREIATNENFDGPWADTENGAVGDLSDTVIDRVPVGSREALANVSITGPVSVYLHQRA